MFTESLETETISYEEEKLLKGDSAQLSPRWRARPKECGGFTSTLFMFAALLTAVSCFFAGALFSRGIERAHQPNFRKESHRGAVPQVPLNGRVKTFHLDNAFTAVPKSGKVEPAWDSLMPNGLGYIANTTLAPDLSVVAVFHQLHCLYTLRRAYYAPRAPGSNLEDFDFGNDRVEHVNHCFEYLRQSMLCSADSSIEPAAGIARGDHTFIGWDVPRQCRDYDQLKQWAEQRRAFDGHGFLAKDYRPIRSEG